MIEIIAPVLVGGVLALGGAFIGPFFQRKHEKWRADREDDQLLRDKAEDVFSELDRLTSGTRKSSATHVRMILDDSQCLVPMPELEKIRALAGVYFPSLREQIDHFEASVAKDQKLIIAKIDNYKDKSASNPEELKTVVALVSTMRSKHADKFAEDVRTNLSNSLPRLK